MNVWAIRSSLPTHQFADPRLVLKDQQKRVDLYVAGFCKPDGLLQSRSSTSTRFYADREGEKNGS